MTFLDEIKKHEHELIYERIAIEEEINNDRPASASRLAQLEEELAYIDEQLSAIDELIESTEKAPLS